MDTYITQLIKSNNRVIIPDFGAFIVKQGATKSISFNEFLKFNDGLLINFVAEKDQTDRIVARKKVNDYVQKIIKDLDEKGNYTISGMGTLIKKEKKIEFEQDTEFWTGANLTSVEEENAEGKTDTGATNEKKEGPGPVTTNKVDEEKSTDKPETKKNEDKEKEDSESIIKQPGKTYNVREPRKKESVTGSVPPPPPPPPAPAPPRKKAVKNNVSSAPHNNRKRQKSLAPVMWSGAFVVIIVAAVLIWFFLKDNSGKNEPIDQSGVEQVSSADPFAKDSLNSKSETNNTQKNITAVNTPSKKVTASEKKTVSQAGSSAKRYYIVAGCFKNEANADKYVKHLKTKGYNAEKFGMLGPLHAVCFTSYDSRKKAIAEMQKIRKDFEPHAWVIHY
ncbi:MAG TPA: SPOR domain-containing protein [Bacteroidales bacterium]|nr:SPOR domain-containing protein [Bacteroidales bacterium]